MADIGEFTVQSEPSEQPEQKPEKPKKKRGCLRVFLILILIIVLIIAGIVIFINYALKHAPSIAAKGSSDVELSYDEEDLSSVIDLHSSEDLGMASMDSSFTYSVAKTDSSDDVLGSYSGPLAFDLTLASTDEMAADVINAIGTENDGTHTFHVASDDFSFELEPYDYSSLRSQVTKLAGDIRIVDYDNAEAMAVCEGFTITDSNITSMSLETLKKITDQYGVELPEIEDGYAQIPYSVVYCSDGSLIMNFYVCGEAFTVDGNMNLE